MKTGSNVYSKVFTYDVLQWEALALLLIGISVNQLRSLPEGSSAMGLPVTTGAYLYTLIFVSVSKAICYMMHVRLCLATCLQHVSTTEIISYLVTGYFFCLFVMLINYNIHMVYDYCKGGFAL